MKISTRPVWLMTEKELRHEYSAMMIYCKKHGGTNPESKGGREMGQRFKKLSDEYCTRQILRYAEKRRVKNPVKLEDDCNHA